MTGQYSMKSFFRQMPNALLARYFKEKRDSRRHIDKVPVPTSTANNPCRLYQT